MLQTIEVEIDSDGRIHPLEALSFTPAGRAYLTLLPSQNMPSSPDKTQSGVASQALQLLASARFSRRPVADLDEVQQRIHALRNEWGD
jgi:hypothetical protein